jgi:hypothetical protein
VNWTHLGTVAGSCEDGNELSVQTVSTEKHNNGIALSLLIQTYPTRCLLFLRRLNEQSEPQILLFIVITV